MKNFIQNHLLLISLLFSAHAHAECVPFATERAGFTLANVYEQEKAFCAAVSEADCKSNTVMVGGSSYCGWVEPDQKQMHVQNPEISKPPVPEAKKSAKSEIPSDASCKQFDQAKYDFLTKEAKPQNGGLLCSEANSKQKFGPAEKNLYLAMAKVMACTDFHVSEMDVTETSLERGFTMPNSCEQLIDLSNANATIGAGKVSVKFQNAKRQELSFDSHYNVVGPARSVDYWYQQLSAQIIGRQDVETLNELNALMPGVGRESTAANAQIEGSYTNKGSLGSNYKDKQNSSSPQGNSAASGL